MVEETTPLTGGCLCGEVRYEVSDPPNKGGLCHCRVCQKTTGSAFEALFGCLETKFHYTKGEPKRYRSSSIMEKSFCHTCGNPLTDQYIVSASEFFSKDKVWVRIGTLDAPEAISITLHTGVESQMSWLHFDDGNPRTRCDEDPELAAAFAAAEAGEE